LKEVGVHEKSNVAGPKAALSEYLVHEVGGERIPIFPLDEYEHASVRQEKDVEPGSEGDEEESEIPVALPKTEGIVRTQEKKGHQKDEKEGSDDDNIEKNENCPKFHAAPLL
jgi:hypothetical protein